MALPARGILKLIINPYARRDVSPWAFKYLLERSTEPTNWDGEILLIPSMSSMEMEQVSSQLMGYGFYWEKGRRDSDFAWAIDMPELDWLEQVKARPLKKGLDQVVLWQKRHSTVDWFAAFGQIYRRGEDYEW